MIISLSTSTYICLIVIQYRHIYVNQDTHKHIYEWSSYLGKAIQQHNKNDMVTNLLLFVLKWLIIIIIIGQKIINNRHYEERKPFEMPIYQWF